MEASEKPQLEIGDDPDGTVRALANRDRDRRPDRRRRAGSEPRPRAGARRGRRGRARSRDAIVIGARVLDRESTGAEVDLVKSELRSQLGELETDSGPDPRGRRDPAGEMLSQQFGAERNDSVQAQIKETVGRTGDRAAGGPQSNSDRRGRIESVGRLPGAPVKASCSPPRSATGPRSSASATSTARSRGSCRSRSRTLDARRLARLLEREEADERVGRGRGSGTAKGRSPSRRWSHALIEDIAVGPLGRRHPHRRTSGPRAGPRRATPSSRSARRWHAAGDGSSSRRRTRSSPRTTPGTSSNAAHSRTRRRLRRPGRRGDDKVPSGASELPSIRATRSSSPSIATIPTRSRLELAYRLAAARVTMARGGTSRWMLPRSARSPRRRSRCLQQAQADQVRPDRHQDIARPGTLQSSTR